MKIINRYVLRTILVPLLGITLVVLVTLLLERLLRLIDLMVNTQTSFFIILQMLGNLVPHYIGIAVPIAFFLSMAIALTRMNQASEFEALSASGIGFHQLLVPTMILGVVLMSLVIVVSSYFQPYTRYAYRALIHKVTNASFTAAIREGVFAHGEKMSIMAERVLDDGLKLERVFVYLEKPKGGSVTITASKGALVESKESLQASLILRDGVLMGRDEHGETHEIKFDEYKFPISQMAEGISYRLRGKDEREMTLYELWSEKNRPPSKATQQEIRTELHERLVRTVTLFPLPFLAILLSLSSKRTRRPYGIAVGLLILVIYHEIIEFGAALASFGNIPIWTGLWLPFGLFSFFSIFLFYNATLRVGHDPLGSLVEGLEEFTSPFFNRFTRRGRR